MGDETGVEKRWLFFNVVWRKELRDSNMLKQPSVDSVQWWQEQDLNRMFGKIILGPELLLLTLYTLAKIYDNAAFKVLYSLITREELIRWKRPWCWEGLGARGEGNDRGWDGWMASPTRWTWVWVNSGSWWWPREAWRAVIHGVVKSRHDWATELTDWQSHTPTAPNLASFKQESQKTFLSRRAKKWVCW